MGKEIVVNLIPLIFLIFSSIVLFIGYLVCLCWYYKLRKQYQELILEIEIHKVDAEVLINHIEAAMQKEKEAIQQEKEKLE